ncbi:MAG: aminotransferase class IV [Sulfurimonas sp.]|nr:aminotransferase class IV [Sulfurimonas sp.]
MKYEFLETIRVKDGIYSHLSYHQSRYTNVLNSFDVKNIQRLDTYLNTSKKGLYRCRLIYNLQKIINIQYIKYKKREINSLKLVYDDEIDYSFKYLNRKNINSLFALRESCDDILIVKNGYITDTSVANIAFFDGQWKTPSSPLLKGTTRARYLNEGKIVESEIKVSDIKNFTKIALLNAMIDFDIIQQQNIKDIFC